MTDILVCHDDMGDTFLMRLLRLPTVFRLAQSLVRSGSQICSRVVIIRCTHYSMITIIVSPGDYHVQVRVPPPQEGCILFNQEDGRY